MKKIRNKVPKIKNNIVNYVRTNLKEYILVSLLFIIGIFVGVIIINNCSEVQGKEICTFISEFINKFKDIQSLDTGALIIDSIKNNLILTVIIWLAGTTVIGVPVVLAVVLFRGFCFGYTVSAIAYTLGSIKGCLFCIITLCAQNILFIPAILSLGVSSLKLYKSIIKDRRRENIKIEILRHSFFSGLMLCLLIISSLIENIISIKLLQNTIKFF